MDACRLIKKSPISPAKTKNSKNSQITKLQNFPARSEIWYFFDRMDENEEMSRYLQIAVKNMAIKHVLPANLLSDLARVVSLGCQEKGVWVYIYIYYIIYTHIILQKKHTHTHTHTHSINVFFVKKPILV